MKHENTRPYRFIPPLRFDRHTLKIYCYSLLTGLASGVVVVTYRGIIGYFEGLRHAMLPTIAPSLVKILIWLAIAGVAGWLVSLLVQRSPMIKGSGIPQVKAYLMRRIDFDWKVELPFKFAGGALALGAGLSLGREGPSIQLGALTGSAIDQKFCKGEMRRFLVTAGAAAGISAAFNAPLAGVLFCIEELHRNVSPILLTSALLASFAANAIMWVATGNAAIFPLEITATLPLRHYFIGVLGIGIAAGILGSLFNLGLVGFQRLYARLIPASVTRILLAFIIAAGISLVAAPITGGGGELVEELALGRSSLALIALLLAGKLVFTLFSYASGAPGGIFLPMLSIGALVGALIHGFFPHAAAVQEYLSNFILLGMAGFFVAVVRAPITGAVLITEMAGSLAHFPAFIFVAIAATATAEILGTRPIYDTLLTQLAPQNLESDDHRPLHIHIPIHEGCPFASCGALIRQLPEGSLLVSVQRGETYFFPTEALSLQPGDLLNVVVERGRASSLKSRLLALSQGREEL